MRESGYYPMGAEHDPHAPWNQRDPEPVMVPCTVMETISRRCECATTEYYREVTDEPWNEIHEEEVTVTHGYDYSAEYGEQYWGPAKLLAMMADAQESKLEFYGRDKDRIREMIEEARGWTREEYECQRED